MQVQYARQNMRHRGPMESQKLLDAERQIQQNLERLRKRTASLRERVELSGVEIATGGASNLVDGSLYRQAEKLAQDINSTERWESND